LILHSIRPYLSGYDLYDNNNNDDALVFRHNQSHYLKYQVKTDSQWRR